MKKIRLEVRPEELAEIMEMLEKGGFVISEDEEDYVLLQKDIHLSHLAVRNKAGDRLHVPVEDILYMESYGHSIDVVCQQGRCQSNETLRELISMLDPTVFVRISNSVIINRRHVREIIPGFSMKFRVRMSDNSIVEVTRSYYNSFKEFFRI